MESFFYTIISYRLLFDRVLPGVLAKIVFVTYDSSHLVLVNAVLQYTHSLSVLRAIFQVDLG